MKLRTEVAITGANEPPRADIVFDGRGGALATARKTLDEERRDVVALAHERAVARAELARVPARAPRRTTRSAPRRQGGANG